MRRQGGRGIKGEAFVTRSVMNTPLIGAAGPRQHRRKFTGKSEELRTTAVFGSAGRWQTEPPRGERPIAPQDATNQVCWGWSRLCRVGTLCVRQARSHPAFTPAGGWLTRALLRTANGKHVEACSAWVACTGGRGDDALRARYASAGDATRRRGESPDGRRRLVERNGHF